MRAFLQSIYALFCFTINAFGVVHYVNVNNAVPSAPYTSWATAATRIQDAIDVASPGEQILVTNGVYQTGGRAAPGALTNRVAVTKPLMVQSVNGPAVTFIVGFRQPVTPNGTNAIRCVYLTNGAALSGFTLTNGATRDFTGAEMDQSGAGVWCNSLSAVVSNCVLVGNCAYSFGGGSYSGTIRDCAFTNNSTVWGVGGGAGACLGTLDNCTFVQNSGASGSGGGVASATVSRSFFLGNSASYGGAAGSATLIRCVLSGNTATFWGGAVMNCALNDCLVIGNVAGWGGGARDSVLRSCTVVSNSASNFGGGNYSGSLYDTIIYYNSAPNEPDNSGGISYYCCSSTPGGPNIGTITNAPLFVNPSAGMFNLQSNSPCINAGRNSNVTNFTDLAGNPRIVGGTADIGAYEFQFPKSVISYGWLQLYGLPVDGTVDFLDLDGDGHNTWQEWRADTSPINASSVLKILFVINAYPGQLVIWQSASTRNYAVERSTNFAASPAFLTLTTNTGGGGHYTDLTATNAGPYFYRIRLLE